MWLLCQLPAACRNCLPLDALDVLLGAGQAKTPSKEVAGIIRYAGEHPETFADRSSNAVNIYQNFKCCSGFEEGWVRIAACPKPSIFPSLCDIFCAHPCMDSGCKNHMASPMTSTAWSFKMKVALGWSLCQFGHMIPCIASLPTGSLVRR